jgi:hypothetical protein
MIDHRVSERMLLPARPVPLARRASIAFGPRAGARVLSRDRRLRGCRRRIALVPESVLATMQTANVARHSLPRVHADIVTPLIWRTSGASPAFAALRALVSRKPARALAARRVRRRILASARTGGAPAEGHFQSRTSGMSSPWTRM